MRIIRGTHRGRKIIAPANLPVRPTTDLAKESMFNILDNNFYFEDIQVLDLFAGTGNISYEFASRECQLVMAVEQNPRCAKFISETAAKLSLDKLKVIKGPVEGFLKHTALQFDIIFADPPYDMEGKAGIAELVFGRSLLKDDGWLVIEHSKSDEFRRFPQFFDQRRYGKVNFSFFREEKSRSQGPA